MKKSILIFAFSLIGLSAFSQEQPKIDTTKVGKVEWKEAKAISETLSKVDALISKSEIATKESKPLLNQLQQIQLFLFSMFQKEEKPKK